MIALHERYGGLSRYRKFDMIFETLLGEELKWFEAHVRGNADWTLPPRPEESGSEEAKTVS